jgi:tRNA nucleotidyltransferase (CCA-adding enzyme)
MKELFSNVIKEVTPNKDYENDILNKTDDIIKKLNKNIKDVKVILGGSGAKGTWLKTFDVDIFVKFNYNKYKDKSDKLSEILVKSLKKLYPKVIRLHGSRDYFQIKQSKFTFEIIPILDIKKAEQAKNITDVSPLHSKFVLQHKKLGDEIRLTKQFCKANGVYGAESYIRGFSGYICEILTINYGSFLNLIKNAAKWKDKALIDVKKFYKGKDIFLEINKSKLVSPLIVIDPVQKDRNAAAALSNEKFELFRTKAKQFIKKPSKTFFTVKEFNIDNIKSKFKNKNLILLEIEPLKRKEDVSGAKLLKAFEFFTKGLDKKEFKTVNSNWNWDKKTNAYFYFVFERTLLSATKELSGPPVKLKFHAEKFRKKYKKTRVKGKILVAIVKRDFRKPEELVRILVKDEYIKDKVKSIKIIN